ncbi:hypothetical protein BN2476_1240047 [Paraburkholderia piptadeniae]|uniref:Uncharacterized protein n=1 Tax=Paraburkholderia piptadeniae TaxID=1701573 RepID=A0A1N7SVS8_9BURK|nr:hypothetical protein BN2476_1240047 [Paraburkholderia piptadeniae]
MALHPGPSAPGLEEVVLMIRTWPPRRRRHFYATPHTGRAQQVLRSVHGSALAIATARTELLQDQEALYDKVFFWVCRKTISIR